jgi:hypothetical protein
LLNAVLTGGDYVPKVTAGCIVRTTTHRGTARKPPLGSCDGAIREQ